MTVWRTTDGGATWFESTPLDVTDAASIDVLLLAADDTGAAAAVQRLTMPRPPAGRLWEGSVTLELPRGPYQLRVAAATPDGMKTALLLHAFDMRPPSGALVLGTDDARAYASRAGLDTVTPAALGAGDIDAIVVCDDAGFALLDGLNAALTAAVRAIDQGRRLALVCPNPDIIYPRGGDALGFTAGGLALVLEAGLRRRHPGAPGFVYLGKPAPAIFELARATLPGGARPLMIGDQLETDIAGACGAGIECALVTGVSRWRDGETSAHVPRWLLDDLS